MKTNIDKYLDIYNQDDPDDEAEVKDGKVTIHVGSHGYTDGSLMLMASSRGGKQLNFFADGAVEFEVPDDIEPRAYTVTLDVCTVHLKQSPLLVSVDGGEAIPMEVPYTIGEWQETKGIQIELSGGENIRFTRPKPSFGMTIKQIMLS